jgi:very-short-patch-repair endonuclease
MFIPQAKVGRYVVDFLLPIHSLVIEADGSYWHREGFRKESEKKRDDIIRIDFGLSIVRIPEEDIKDGKFDNLEFAIENQLPTYKQTEIFEVQGHIKVNDVTRNSDQKNNQEILCGYGL